MNTPEQTSKFDTGILKEDPSKYQVTSIDSKGEIH